MPEPAIRVQNLSKRYRIGAAEEKHETLAAALAHNLRRPLHNLRRLRRLTRFSANGHEPDDTIWALKDVSFEVQPGEVVGIIGRNGAGKSTLLKILSRITHPTSGRVELNGRVSSLLEVGTGFHPELTGRENIYLNGTILGMRKSEIDRKFDEIVDFSGVEKFIDTPVKRYSSGMRVRLAFSVAAHLEPEILLVDEVLAVGDVEFQKKCLGKMEEVAGRGRTVLFVSHNMAMIKALCSRVMLLENGQSICDGDPDLALSNYLTNDTIEVDKRRVYLRENTKRDEGSGILRFTAWSIWDNLYGTGTRVGCNNPCEFRIQYESKHQSHLTRVSVALTICDTLGVPLLTGWTRFHNADFGAAPPAGTFICHFERMPLVNGIYRIHLWCAVDGSLADNVVNAGNFEVLATDVFGSGKLPVRNNHGAYVIKEHSWSLLTRKEAHAQ